MFRLNLFGGVSIAGTDGPLSGRAFQRRRLAVLALLGAAPSGLASRDRLIGFLWPDSDTEQARHLLAVSLYELRKALGEEALISQGDDVQLNPRLVTSDVQEFEGALGRGELELAVSLYAGPFLDGFFVSRAPEYERWAEGERDRLARRLAGALESLAQQAGERGEWAQAVESLRRLAVHDPFNSRVAGALIRAMDRAGDRAGALQHARIHETLLRQEFGVEPDPSITALAERLRREVRAAPDPTPPDSASPAQSAAPIEPSGPVEGAGPAAPAEVSEMSELSEPVPAPEPAVAAAPLPAPDAAQPVHAVPPPPARSRWPGRWLAAAALAGLLAAGGWATWRWARPVEATAARLAVLPFDDTSREDFEYLGDGITDDLINTLTQVPGLRVAARTSAFAFKGRHVDVREIGERLGVEAVLEGSIRKEGDRLHVSVRLVDAEEGYHLWARAYDRGIEDVFAIQDEIAREVIASLLGEREVAPSAAASRTANLAAYHLYLKGRFLWHQRDEPRHRVENLRQSVDYYQRSLHSDPAYALAYAGLADSYASLAGPMPPADAYRRARAAARRALELDGSLAEAHTALARIQVFHDWDWDGAERSYRRAIQLSPQLATARQWYGMYLLHRGRPERALAELRRAQQLDPLSLSAASDLGRALYYARRYDEAVQQFRAVLELDPTNADAWLYTGLTLAEQGRHEGAVNGFQRWSASTGDEPTALTGYALAVAGRHDEARRIVAQLEAERGERRGAAVGIALIHARLGDRDAAFRWLDRAVGERSSFLLFLRVSPRVDPLREDPRFEQLLRRVGLPTDD